MRRLLIIAPVVIVLEYFLWNLPSEIIYHESLFISLLAIPGNVFIIIPALIWFSVSRLNSKNWAMLAILSIPINGYGWARSAQIREINALEEFGRKATGIVIDKRRAPRRYANDWNIEARFQVNSDRYVTDPRPDWDNKFNVKDSIEIIYLPMNPNVNRLLDELK